MTELAQLSSVLEEATTRGHIPGAVAVVHHRGAVVHRSAHGVLDADLPYPLTPDTVLWLASLSKVVGAAAVLGLVDEGRLALTDPVSAFVPEFGAPGRVRVLQAGSPSPFSPPFGPPPDPLPVFDIVPAERELTVQDLLTHTGGLQSITVWNPEYVPPAPGQTLADHVPDLAGVVRDFQAGQGWAYSNGASYDVVSRVVEVVTGAPLRQVLRDRLLDPLGMHSTDFGRAEQPGVAPIPAFFASNPVLAGDTFQTTSAGLWSSPEDYLTLVDMIAAGGVHEGRRVLSEESTARMTSNLVGDLCPGLNGREPAPGLGFGLGVAVVEDPAAAGEHLPAGTWGWDGVGTRRVWVSPTGGWSAFLYVPDQGVQRDAEGVISAALR